MELEKLGIKFEIFDLNEHIPCEEPDHPPFFSPMDPETLNTYHPDLSDPMTKEQVRILFDRCETLVEGGWSTPGNIAGHLSSTFVAGLSSMSWTKNEGKDPIELMELTSWHPVDGVTAFDCRDWEASYVMEQRAPQSRIYDMWLSKTRPHIMIAMSHAHKSDDDSLFVSEIYAIIALMFTRLLNDSFRDDNVVPVLAFSFTSDKRIRILQAHMDCIRGLMIRKTMFYDHDYRNDKYMHRFLRYAVGDLRGSTRVLQMPNKWLKLPEEPKQ